MITDLVQYTTNDLEALEQERPELGRLEIIDGALHATGESAVGVTHQLIVQKLFMLFASACPRAFLVMIDTWWKSPRGTLRVDIGIYRPQDLPAKGEVFRVPPQATLEVVSDDAFHDVLHKDAIYAQFGARRAYLDPRQREGWWLRLDGTEHDGPRATWNLDGWPPLTFDRATLLAKPSAS